LRLSFSNRALRFHSDICVIVSEKWEEEIMTGERTDRLEDQSSECDCSECNCFLEALRDMEQQCREAENARFRELEARSEMTCEQLIHEGHLYQIRMQTLERRRDYALELLAKHQRLEH
jgi:hypothetical protein